MTKHYTTFKGLKKIKQTCLLIFILFSDKDFKIYQEILSVMNRS